MRVHYFPEDALSMELPCFLCHIEHKDCTLDDCKRAHVYVLTDEEYAKLVRTGKK